MITPERLDAIEARAHASASARRRSVYFDHASYIALAAEDVLALVAEVRRMRKALDWDAK